MQQVARLILLAHRGRLAVGLGHLHHRGGSTFGHDRPMAAGLERSGHQAKQLGRAAHAAVSFLQRKDTDFRPGVAKPNIVDYPLRNIACIFA